MRRTALRTLAGSALVAAVGIGIAAPQATAEHRTEHRTEHRAAQPAARPAAHPAAPTSDAVPVPVLPADALTSPGRPTSGDSAAPRGLAARADRPASLAASAADARARSALDGPTADDAARSNPVEDPYYPEYSNPEVDALHYWLDLRWDGQTLNGFTTVDLRVATDTPTLNLALGSSLKISRAWLDGKPVQASQSGNQATFQTGQLGRDKIVRLQILYSGAPQCVRAPSPRSDLQCIGWNKQGDRVWAIQQPYGAFTWFPVNETPSDKALYDARITTSNGKVGVFNGVPMTQWDSTQGNTVVRNYHLDSPATSYLTTIAIGDYRSDSVKVNDGKSWVIWYTPTEQSKVPALKSEAVSSYDFMTRNAGAYPFSSIGNVMIPSSQAMETQTMITMGTREIRPIIMHELGHHWFGDTVSPKTWKDMWLNEGWTMYMQGLYEGRSIGSFQQSCRASVPNDGQAGSPRRDRFAQPNVYECPATIFDTIRRELGQAKFTELATAWAAEHRNQSVDRAEFERWINAKTGKNYSQLIAQWLDNVR